MTYIVPSGSRRKIELKSHLAQPPSRVLRVLRAAWGGRRRGGKLVPAEAEDSSVVGTGDLPLLADEAGEPSDKRNSLSGAMPRAMRDLTVPTGNSRMVAISL